MSLGAAMPLPPQYSSGYWRDRAAVAHAWAENLTDPDARATMEDIARGYEAMARRAEEREKGRRGPAMD